MNNKLIKYLRWIGVISFLIIPPLLVRISVDGAAVRIISYCLLIVIAITIGAYFLLRRGSIVADMPISKDLKTEQGKRIAEIFFRALPLAVAAIGLFMAGNIAPSLLSYAFNNVPAVDEVHTIIHIDSPAMPGAFFLYLGITTDDKKYLSFSYPDQTLQVGHKYLFTLLPNSDFVLSAYEVN